MGVGGLQTPNLVMLAPSYVDAGWVDTSQPFKASARSSQLTSALELLPFTILGIAQ